MMNGINGYELCRKIKGSLATSYILVILVTGLSSVDDKIKWLEAGADSYIYKPFYVNHLLARVEHLLRGREELRHRFEARIPIEFGESKGVSQLDNDCINKLYKLFDANLDNEGVVWIISQANYAYRELLPIEKLSFNTCCRFVAARWCQYQRYMFDDRL